MMMHDLAIQKTYRPWVIPSERRLRALFERALRMHPHARRVSLVCTFIGDAAMERLNRAYRGKHRTTDVLSFVYTNTRVTLDGEIVISVPQARRQARQIGQSVEDELSFLFVHGVLHTFGLDHEQSAAEERRMIALQKKILMRR